MVVMNERKYGEMMFGNITNGKEVVHFCIEQTMYGSIKENLQKSANITVVCNIVTDNGGKIIENRTFALNDYTEFTLAEFASLYNMNVDVVTETFKDCHDRNYVTEYMKYIKNRVGAIEDISKENYEALVCFIYANSYNVHSPRTYDSKRGWGTTIYSTISDCPKH